MYLHINLCPNKYNIATDDFKVWKMYGELVYVYYTSNNNTYTYIIIEANASLTDFARFSAIILYYYYYFFALITSSNTQRRFNRRPCVYNVPTGA